MLVDVTFEVRYKDGSIADSESPVTSTHKLHADTLINELDRISTQLFSIPNSLDIKVTTRQQLELHVSERQSVYQPSSDSNLQISWDQPLVEYFKQYRSHHQLLESLDRTKCISIAQISRQSRPSAGGTQTIHWPETTVRAGPARLRFFRTLRVPDNVKNYLLPPGLGTFPLIPSERYEKTLPLEIKRRGGYLMPIFQREALWIGFNGSGKCAVKVSVGGVNAITGESQSQSPSGGRIQDYVTLPKQPWLDGICTSSGGVRQFVAMKLGHGYTIEEQLTGKAVHGGIQIDVYPSLEGNVVCKSHSVSTWGMDITRSPRELGLSLSTVIGMTASSLPPCTTVGDLRTRVSFTPKVVVNCFPKKPVVLCRDSIPDEPFMVPIMPSADTRRSASPPHSASPPSRPAPPPQLTRPPPPPQLTRHKSATRRAYSASLSAPLQPSMAFPIQASCALCSEPQHAEAPIGIAAGGQIQQRIYEDTKRPNIYDEAAHQRVWIHAISTDLWESITGVIAPITPIVPGTYKAYDYPWFSLLDEKIPTLQPTGNFQNLRSVRQLDTSDSSQASRLPDANNPPNCSAHNYAISSCVLRPCGHYVCDACFGRTIIGRNKCSVCKQAVSKMIGFKEPIPQVNDGGGSESPWWSVAEKIDGVSIYDDWKDAKVVTLVLDEDSVSRLSNSL